MPRTCFRVVGGRVTRVFSKIVLLTVCGIIGYYEQ